MRWAGRAIAPPGLARRILSADTVGLSSFWAHPRQLVTLRPIDFASMLLAPALTASVCLSWRRLVSTSGSAPLPRRLVLAATAATPLCALLLVFGAAEWALAGFLGLSGLFSARSDCRRPCWW